MRALGNNLVESSVLVRPPDSKDVSMKKRDNRQADRQIEELEYLNKLSDEQINVEDIPEMTDWSGAQRGLFYKPVKQQITLRLDADVLHWFRAHMPNGRGYQTAINQALRDHIKREIAG